MGMHAIEMASSEEKGSSDFTLGAICDKKRLGTEKIIIPHGQIDERFRKVAS